MDHSHFWINCFKDISINYDVNWEQCSCKGDTPTLSIFNNSEIYRLFVRWKIWREILGMIQWTIFLAHLDWIKREGWTSKSLKNHFSTWLFICNQMHWISLLKGLDQKRFRTRMAELSIDSFTCCQGFYMFPCIPIPHLWCKQEIVNILHLKQNFCVYLNWCCDNLIIYRKPLCFALWIVGHWSVYFWRLTKYSEAFSQSFTKEKFISTL